MIEKHRSQYLKWFIDFLNKDLGTLSPGEKMHLVYDVIIIIFGMGDLLFGYEKTTLPPERWGIDKSVEEIKGEFFKGDKLKSYQKLLKDIFLDLLKNYKDAYDIVKKGRKPTSDLKHFFELKEILLNVNMKLRTPMLEWESLMKRENNLTALMTIETLIEAPIHLTVKAQKHEDTLLYYFFQALEGLPLKAIRGCIECGNFFIHTSKRKRKYCSNKCSMRNANRERRRRIKEKDEKKYKHELAEGRKRAKISRDKRIKKKLGNNVKIGR
jgi:hypothetical protein